MGSSSRIRSTLDVDKRLREMARQLRDFMKEEGKEKSEATNSDQAAKESV